MAAGLTSRGAVLGFADTVFPFSHIVKSVPLQYGALPWTLVGAIPHEGIDTARYCWQMGRFAPDWLLDDQKVL